MKDDENLLVILIRLDKIITWLNLFAILTEYYFSNQDILFWPKDVSEFLYKLLLWIIAIYEDTSPYNQIIPANPTVNTNSTIIMSLNFM